MVERTETDPAFAAIQLHRDAVAVIDAIPVDDDDSPIYQAACKVEDTCLQALARVVPTTPAGAAALIERMIECERAHIGVQATGSPFEIMAGTIVAALRKMEVVHG